MVAVASGTPDSKTVSDCQKVSHGYNLESHLDYLTVTGNVVDKSWVDGFLDKYFGTVLDWSVAVPRWIGVKWDESLTCPLGISVACRWVKELSVYAVRIAIPGKPLMNRSVGRVKEMCEELIAAKFKATRFDWAIDDMSRMLKIADVVDAVNARNYAGFNKYKYIESGTRTSSEIGSTVALGSRKSDRYVRIYDKQIESQGEIDSIRYEVEYKNRLADYMLRLYALTDNLEMAHVELSKIAVGNVKFLERDSEHIDRCEMLGWWRDFVIAVGGCVKVSLPRLQKMITEKKAWVETKVSSTIAVICNCLGFDETFKWLEYSVRKAEGRFTSRHHAYIETWKKRRYVE